MSLLDDARRLAKNGFTPWEDSCHLTCELCGEDFAEEGAQHAPNCPWLSMPKIVAVLEAADIAVKEARREMPNRLLYPGHPLSDLALALYGAPTAIVRQVVPSE